MNWKYLAYFALLAGWIWFCFWLYSHAIFPKLKGEEAQPYPARLEHLELPLAFKWGSAIPYAGKGFDDLQNQLHHLDSTRSIVVIQGYYFMDESDSTHQLIDLVRQRVTNTINVFSLDPNRILVEYLPQQITADVRSHPFMAVHFDQYQEEDILNFSGDTARVCFPIPDSITLPPLILTKLDQWKNGQVRDKGVIANLIGTADGTGIAESSDVAMDRAMMIKTRWINQGWQVDQFQLSSTQRNAPYALQNRCVMVYFEEDAKQ